jgi:hypothetical protein
LVVLALISSASCTEAAERSLFAVKDQDESASSQKEVRIQPLQEDPNAMTPAPSGSQASMNAPPLQWRDSQETWGVNGGFGVRTLSDSTFEVLSLSTGRLLDLSDSERL